MYTGRGDISEKGYLIQIGPGRFCTESFGGHVISEQSKIYEKWHFQELEIIDSRAQ